MSQNNQQATVREVDGQLVLDDPEGLAFVQAVGKHNCRVTAEQQVDRIAHFTRRIAERGVSVNDVLIVLINMDDPFGSDVGDALMPGHDWQAYRDRGEVPFARGLAGRQGIQEALDQLDPEEATKLHRMATALVVFDHGTVAVFEAASIGGADPGSTVKHQKTARRAYDVPQCWLCGRQLLTGRCYGCFWREVIR